MADKKVEAKTEDKTEDKTETKKEDKGDGTRENPWKTSVGHTYFGKQAIAKVEEVYPDLKGKLTAPMKRVIELEGFVDGHYYDDAKPPVLTYGVGQTGKYIDEGFISAFNDKQAMLEETFGPMSKYTEKLQSEFMSIAYRGDFKKGHSWVKHFLYGDFENAADTFLIHKEYMDRKKKNPNDGVVKRLDAFADAVRSDGNISIEQALGVSMQPRLFAKTDNASTSSMVSDFGKLNTKAFNVKTKTKVKPKPKNKKGAKS